MKTMCELLGNQFEVAVHLDVSLIPVALVRHMYLVSKLSQLGLNKRRLLMIQSLDF